MPVPADLETGAAEVTLNHVAGVQLGPDDVFRQITGGGAGWKDPLLRDPARVEADVRAGYVSVEQARHAYGVVVGDEAATAAARAEIRRERLGRDPRTEPAAAQLAANRMPVVRGEDGFACGYCGESLGRGWQDALVLRESDLTARMAELELEVQPREDPRLMLRELYCPGCGSCLHTQIER